jgi:hypothetical protein
VLFVFRIPPEQTPDRLLSGKFPSLRKSEYRPSNSLRNTLLQRAVELPRSILSSPPAVSYHYAGANCSVGNPPPRGNPGLKCTRTETILKKFDQKMNFKFKQKMSSGIVQTSDLSNYTICSLPNLVRLSL